jgi:hypothetical protein
VHRPRLVKLLLAATVALAGLGVLSGPAAALRDRPDRAPTRTARPHISGLPNVGSTLRAHPGRWAGASGFAYRWQRCNARGKHCKTVPAGRHRPYAKSTYKIASSDLGQRMRVMVIARNRWGTRTAWSHMTAKITRATPPPTHGPAAPAPPAPGSGSGSGSGGSGGSGGGGGGGLPNIGSGQSVAFWLGWDSSMTESQMPWNAVTQVDLFALQTTAGSGLDTSLLNPTGNVANWVSTVHQHHRLALITIGGISDQHWDTACGNTYRSAFVTNLINYMVSNGFDGVDIDIEQDNWGSQQAPVAAWDTCVQAISTAAHAAATKAGATPVVSTDVDQTWMDPYIAGFASSPDQFNLMGYSDSCSASCMAGQVQDLLTTARVPSPSKLTMGVDVDQGDTGATVTPAQCGSIASYASAARLGGVMLWTVQGDGASHPCLNQMAPYVAPAP